MNHDTVVVGAGVAGLVAAVRLAEAGQRVVVLAKGVGATHHAGATIDVLGYAPERVEKPARALPGFVGSHPKHPYARLPAKAIPESIDWLKSHVTAYRYEGGWEENFLLPTAVGAAKPTAAAPESMTAGDLRAGGRFAIVGLRALKDFYPAFCADNLGRTKLPSGASISARSFQIDLPVGGEADVGPLGYARRLEDAEVRKAMIGQLESQIEPGEIVGLPAVLGLTDPRTVWRELQDGIGAPVFEIPTLPPSVPGIRLFESLRAALRKAGGRLIMGGRVIDAVITGHRVEGVVQDTPGRPVVYGGTSFVLATGGFAAGGLSMDSYGNVSESIFGLAVSGVPPREDVRFLPEYFGEHPMAKSGIEVDDGLRPIDANGQPVFENLFAAGAVLAGALPWKEKSGDGISLSTGYVAASTILKSVS
jgi:glycerol-3-phosphate dehydrogenase subunit B